MSVEGTPANMLVLAIKSLSMHALYIKPASYVGRICETDHNEFTLQPWSEPCCVKSVAMHASVCHHNKAGIVTWKWMNAFLIPA